MRLYTLTVTLFSGLRLPVPCAALFPPSEWRTVPLFQYHKILHPASIEAERL